MTAPYDCPDPVAEGAIPPKQAILPKTTRGQGLATRFCSMLSASHEGNIKKRKFI